MAGSLTRQPGAASPSQTPATRQFYIDAALIAGVNPKPTPFFTALFSTFLQIGQPPPHFLLLTGIVMGAPYLSLLRHGAQARRC